MYSRYLCFKQIVFNSLSLIIWQPGLIGPLAQSAGSGDTYQAAADRLNYGRQDVVYVYWIRNLDSRQLVYTTHIRQTDTQHTQAQALVVVTGISLSIKRSVTMYIV